MEYKIQSIVFPTETKHQQCKELFYRGEAGFLDRENKSIALGMGQNIDFTTYLNACSYRKWKQYTNAGSAVLYLDVAGAFFLTTVGYSKNVMTVERTEYEKKAYDLAERQLIRIEYPENNDQMLGFELCATGGCTIYGGYFSVVCEEDKLNEVCLSIATTTCWKEEFIKKNVELLKKEILEADSEVREHLYVHVVDNGRTLGEEDIFGPHIFLHPNPNTGGSGGFSRGMIESLHQAPEATHVLLMDDDVLILPESIVRTYHMLRLMKDEYKGHFIGGAMLYYEEPFRQHENVGVVLADGNFASAKPTYDHRLILSNLENEEESIIQKNKYAAWWYCCIPTQKIKENGLSLPLFIRCDDVEYSLRCKAEIITMNGICVWHMGFATKYNAVMDQYQQCRNMLIDKACSDIIPDIDVFQFVYKAFRVELLKFNYSTAELIARALEDYLKGPEFIKIDQGEKLIKENAQLNDKMIPISEIEEYKGTDLNECFFEPPRKFIDTWLFRITYNAQRFWPEAWCRKDVVNVAFNHLYQPQKMAMHNRLVAVNPFMKTGLVRKLDKKRFKELKKRFDKAVKIYKRDRVKIEEAYRKESQYLKSEEFWKKYLGMKE